MTQMMLFDSSSLATATAPANATSAINTAVTTHAPISAPNTSKNAFARPVTTVSATRKPATPPNLTNSEPEGDGVHRMGDLARLVLLRYQLVAQRRQEMAAHTGKTARTSK